MKPLKVGDKVICVDNSEVNNLLVGQKYTIDYCGVISYSSEPVVLLKEIKKEYYFASRFIKVGPIDRFFLERSNYYWTCAILSVVVVAALQHWFPTTLITTMFRSIFVGIGCNLLMRMIFTLYPHWLLPHR